MRFLSNEQVRSERALNLTPMIDFLFLMVVFFATMAVSRATTRDTEIELVKAPTSVESPINPSDLKLVHITVTAEGGYKWVTDIHDYPMDSSEMIARELTVQHRKGLLPEDKTRTKVMLRIDKEAKWEPILEALLAIRSVGFEVRPVYQPEEA